MVQFEHNISPTHALQATLMYAAFEILRDHAGELPVKELILQIPQCVELDEWAQERYEKSGYVRWTSMLHFASVNYVKAGFLIKKKGVWYLTPEGESEMRLGPVGLFKSAVAAYAEWQAEQSRTKPESLEVNSDEVIGPVTLDEMEQVAREGLEHYISTKNAYEFQDLVAALLRAMGYHTPFVAPVAKMVELTSWHIVIHLGRSLQESKYR